METRAQGHQSTSKSVYWSQKVRILYDHEEVDTKTGEMGQIPIWIQFCDQLSERQKEW